MSGVTISDFKIRVRLDSNSAIKGLRRLETMLSTLKKNAAKSLVLNVKLKQQAEQLVQATAKQAKEAANLVSKQKEVHAAANKSRVVFGGLVGNIKSANPAMGKVSAGSSKLGANLGRAAKWTSSLGRGLGTAVKMLGKVKSSIFNISNMMTLGFGLYGLFSVVSKITDMVQFIVENGGKVKSSFATLNASIGNLDIAKGMNPKTLNQLKKQQRLFVEQLALTYGVGLGQTAVDYAKFASASANNIGLGTSQDIFKSLTEFGVVYQIGPEKMERVFTAFTQMANKNQVMAEELKTQLGDSLPGALEIFIKALNRTEKYGTVTTQNIWKMMEQGKIVANDVFPYISQVLKEFSSGGLAESLRTVTTQMNIMKEAWYSIFTTGSLNQFDQTLGRIFKSVTGLAKSKGFQTAVGSAVNNALLNVEAGGETFFKELAKFEKEFNAAEGDNEKQVRLAEQFWSKVALPGAKGFFKFIGNKIYKWISSALNNFKAEDFKGFISFLIDVFYQAIVGAFGLVKDLAFGSVSGAVAEQPGRLGRMFSGDASFGWMDSIGAGMLDLWDGLNGNFSYNPYPNGVDAGSGTIVKNEIHVTGVPADKAASEARKIAAGMTQDIMLINATSTTSVGSK